MFDLAPLLQGIVEKFPIAASIIGVIGVLRLVVKPLMSIARSVVSATDSKKDDAILDSVEASAFYKGFSYVLDWFASIKVGPQAQK